MGISLHLDQATYSRSTACTSSFCVSSLPLSNYPREYLSAVPAWATVRFKKDTYAGWSIILVNLPCL